MKKIVKIGQYLAKIWTKYDSYSFFGPPCKAYSIQYHVLTSSSSSVVIAGHIGLRILFDKFLDKFLQELSFHVFFRLLNCRPTKHPNTSAYAYTVALHLLSNVL